MKLPYTRYTDYLCLKTRNYIPKRQLHDTMLSVESRGEATSIKNQFLQHHIKDVLSKLQTKMDLNELE